jgi:hypothetical protein
MAPQWRVSIGLLCAVAGAAMVVYLCLPKDTPPPPGPKPEFCDYRCERERLHQLTSACARAPERGCLGNATTAEQEFIRGRCGLAVEALIRVDAGNGDAELAALIGSCQSEEIDAGPYFPAIENAIRYRDHGATRDALSLRFDGREHITSASLAPDGALFLLTKSLHPQLCTLYELDGSWTTKKVFDGCETPSFAARSRDEIWFADHEHLDLLIGQHWQSPKVIFPQPVTELVASGNDLFAITSGHIEHAENDDWKAETLPAGVTRLFGGGRPVGLDRDGSIATRESNNTWHRQKATSAQAAWSSKSGTIFLVDDAGAVLRSTDHGQSFRDLAAPEKVHLVTGTADDDVYVAGRRGVFRFDGTTWTNFGAESDAVSILANPGEVWVVREPRPL